MDFLINWIIINNINDKILYVGHTTGRFTMVGEVKDWQVIFRKDFEKAIRLQKEYEELVKKYRSIKKTQISHEKRNQIYLLLLDIRIKLDKIKQIDDRQKLILKNYCGYCSVNLPYNNET